MSFQAHINLHMLIFLITIQKTVRVCLHQGKKTSDCAAIKINDSFINECGVASKEKKKKKTNAKIYTQSLKDINFVHKIGAETGVTNGRVVSYEYYDKVINAENQDYVFLVEGTNGIFLLKAIVVC